MTSVESEHEIAGWKHLKSHKNHEAIRDFTEDLTTNLNARSFIGRSQAYFNLNEFSKAIVDAKVALDMDRANIKAWYALGHALFGASKYDGCLAACHNGLEYVRDDPKLLQLLESCQRRIRGEPDEPAKKWGEGHDHAHGHSHDSKDSHDHDHAHDAGHDHDHAHDAGHDHVHAEGHHDGECKHDHDHDHIHGKGHKTAHEVDVHEHKHEHAHAVHHYEGKKEVEAALEHRHDHDHAHK